MSNTKTFKLKEAAREFQAGQSVGFGMSFGIKCQHPKTKEEVWTNYKVVLFSNSAGQIDFYRTALVAGAVVSVSAEKEIIDSYEGQNGVSHSIELLNARLESIHTLDQGQVPQQQNRPQQQPRQPQQAPQQSWKQPQQRPQAPQQPARQGAYNANQPQSAQGFDDFDDPSIPF